MEPHHPQHPRPPGAAGGPPHPMDPRRQSWSDDPRQRRGSEDGDLRRGGPPPPQRGGPPPQQHWDRNEPSGGPRGPPEFRRRFEAPPNAGGGGPPPQDYQQRFQRPPPHNPGQGPPPQFDRPPPRHTPGHNAGPAGPATDEFGRRTDEFGRQRNDNRTESKPAEYVVPLRRGDDYRPGGPPGGPRDMTRDMGPRDMPAGPRDMSGGPRDVNMGPREMNMGPRHGSSGSLNSPGYSQGYNGRERSPSGGGSYGRGRGGGGYDQQFPPPQPSGGHSGGPPSTGGPARGDPRGPPPHAGRGRGRGAHVNKPAWMTEQERLGPPPSAERFPPPAERFPPAPESMPSNGRGDYGRRTPPLDMPPRAVSSGRGDYGRRTPPLDMPPNPAPHRYDNPPPTQSNDFRGPPPQDYQPPPPNGAPQSYGHPPPTQSNAFRGAPPQDYQQPPPTTSSHQQPPPTTSSYQPEVKLEQQQSSSMPQDPVSSMPQPVPEQQQSQSQPKLEPELEHTISQPQQQPPDDAQYTASLHWKNEASTHVEKRPIELPNDVEHISEVEWADDGPKEAHRPGGAAAQPTATPSYCTITGLEKAPRPKMKRPEPCFCEPDLDTQATCCVDTSCALFACQEECPGSCPAGPLCGNKRIQRKEWKKLSVFDAGLKGRGLMVQEHCNKGDFVVEYVGVAVKKRFLDSLFHRYKHERMLYIMALDNDVYIDARHRGGIARYINHSCEPNCVVHRWKVRGISRAGVFALREIQEGEELSFDYQWERKRGRALTKCHCGSATCRGTIESEADPVGGELEDEFEEMEGDWIEPSQSHPPGREIMNRVVKVYFPENDEYYVGDVAEYDEKTGKHLLMYRGDPEEHWTELSKEKWMILDEAGEPYAIARKHLGSAGVSRDSLLINAPDGSVLSSNMTSPRSDFSRSSSPIAPGAKTKNCIYVQTPVKDEMTVRHTVFKCSRYCRVHIETENITVPQDGVQKLAEGQEEDEDLKRAFEESKDGVVWKLVATGLEVKKAIEWLEKMANSIREGLNGGTTIDLAADPDAPQKYVTELIIPRVIIDAVNKRFYSLKGYCYNVEVSYTHSDSKSKQFAKMTLEAEVKNDLERALEYLNGELTKMCLEAGAPMTNIGVYKDLGFLGGELSSRDFQMLFHRDHSPSKGVNTDCSEDLSGSKFAQAFMETNRCSIWVQAEEDMGRVKNNVVINESHSNKPRKIFFGVAPSRRAMLWGHLATRVTDLRRGVRFYHLGANRIYLPTMLEPIKRNGRSGFNYFFDFVQKTTKAGVRVDSITGSSHLRIDGGDDRRIDEQKVSDRVDTAIELIELQIELLRDHHIRKQRWGFGRDWALLLESDNKMSITPVGPKNDEAGSSSQDLTALATAKPSGTTADSLRLSDPRAIGTACLEISEIVNVAGLSEKVAAHACIIFYRYISLVQQPNDSDGPNNAALSASNFKLRDVQLACLFIANKSQKVIKWKRLEEMLEHVYRVFYPGSYFDSSSEEAKNWERRVIKAEQTVLSALNYDVFWPGVDWVVNAVVGTKAMAAPLAENAMALALSGHVLAAGPVLWLKYGPKYAFAAVAGFLSFDIEPLFPALALQPLTVSHAAELIYHSCQALSRMKKTVALQSKHELFSDSKVSMMGTTIQKVQRDCASYISKHQGQSIDDSKFVSSPAYKEISERAKLRRVFPGVAAEKIEKKVLPFLAKICFESKCTIRFSDGMAEGTNDIVLEGSWKALSIAEQLLCGVASLPEPVIYEKSAPANAMSYSAMDRRPPGEGKVIKQVKVQPGLIEMKEIDGKHGWYGTFDSSQTYDAGWKTCLAANAPQEHLDSAGLRWWVPHEYGPSLSGSLCEIFSCPKMINQGKVDMRALALLAQSFAGGYSRLRAQYPALASHLSDLEDETKENDCSVAISLQRWPPEKVELKERSTSGQKMQMGYSVAALQEMQLLHQLHFLIPSPQGHPNFILPLAIALDSDHNNQEKESGTSSITSSKAASDILAMIERNQRSAGKTQVASGSHLVLEPTPLNLHKVISRYQRKGRDKGHLIPSSVLASLCHDILSAISFCHSNHIVLRSLLPDQIHLDHSGTAKLSGLSKVMVLHGKDRTREFDPLKYVRSEKKRKDHNTEDVEPFAAPELLLGGNRHTKETDMWAFGALMANLLIGRQLFPGKDRVSKMTNVFKVVGVPSRDNYEDAKRFPFHSNNMYVIGDEGKKKKYPRGVEKAIRHMLKPFGSTVEEEFSGLINLLDGLLHLDPTRRMTADEALRHPYMVSHSMQIERAEFRKNYVNNWLDLKENVLTKGKSRKSTLLDSFIGAATKSVGKRGDNPVNGGSAEKELKRKAFLIGASSGADGDDLYNLDDFLGSSKKPKFDLS